MMEIGRSHVIAALASMPWVLKSSMFKIMEEVLNQKYVLGNNITDIKNSKSFRKAEKKESKGDIAVIELQGTLMKKAYCVDMLSSPRTLEDVQNDLRTAANNADIGSIILDIESPGGSVAGTCETTQLIKDITKIKPVIGLIGGMCCSGAYWIASACDELYISPSSEVGSIGVYLCHISYEEALEEEGLKITLIHAGKEKVVGNPYFDLSENDLSILQNQVDKIYNIFISDVAKYRKVSQSKVRSEWADGRVFIGSESVDLGMVDGVATFDELINHLS